MLLNIIPGFKAVPWSRQSVAGLSAGRSGFDPGRHHVRLVANKVAMGQTDVSPPPSSGQRGEPQEVPQRGALPEIGYHEAGNSFNG